MIRKCGKKCENSGLMGMTTKSKGFTIIRIGLDNDERGPYY